MTLHEAQDVLFDEIEQWQPRALELWQLGSSPQEIHRRWLAQYEATRPTVEGCVQSFSEALPLPPLSAAAAMFFVARLNWGYTVASLLLARPGPPKLEEIQEPRERLLRWLLQTAWENEGCLTIESNLAELARGVPPPVGEPGTN